MKIINSTQLTFFDMMATMEQTTEKNYDLSNRQWNLTELIFETAFKKRKTDTGIRREIVAATRYSHEMLCRLEKAERGKKNNPTMSHEYESRICAYFEKNLDRKVSLTGSLPLELEAV